MNTSAVNTVCNTFKLKGAILLKEWFRERERVCVCVCGKSAGWPAMSYKPVAYTNRPTYETNLYILLEHPTKQSFFDAALTVRFAGSLNKSQIT
jgi:hypothetical protein